jgi:hypothetical protein
VCLRYAGAADHRGDRVVFDKYVGDTVVFEGGPQGEASPNSSDKEGLGPRPKSVDLARARAIILESSRLQLQRDIERERAEKAALQAQIESEREAKKKISGVNGALARQNLKLKTEFEKLKMECVAAPLCFRTSVLRSTHLTAISYTQAHPLPHIALTDFTAHDLFHVDELHRVSLLAT